LKYYTEQEVRMKYKLFRQQGLIIGSGPTEGARKR